MLNPSSGSIPPFLDSSSTLAIVKYNVSGVARYQKVKLDPHAEQNPRSAFFEIAIILRVDDGEDIGGENVTDEAGKSMNAIKAPPDILRHVLQ